MRKNIIVVMASLAFLPAVSFAAAPTLSDVLDASGISITGHASGSYSYNHISADGTGSGDVLSTNQFTFDQAELMISKLPTEGFGAMVDVFAGQDVAGGTYNYSYTPFSSGIFTQLPQNILPTGNFNKFNNNSIYGGNEVNLHQAIVQYATGGLTVIAGKFATLAGFEVASDPLNTNATRSILFSQQAFTLTGIRAGYKFNDIITAYAGLNNSVTAPIVMGALVTPNTVDTDAHKTVELGLALTPVTNLAVNVTDYLGTEGGGPAGLSAQAKNNFLDLVTTYTIGDLSLAYNGDYNTSKIEGTSDAKFLGHALYANYQVTKTLRAGVRGEITKAWDSIAGGPATKRNELTLTGDYSPAKNFDLVSDVRYAGVQNDPVFGGGGTSGLHQSTFVLKAIYKF